jgi:hypothetical protein
MMLAAELRILARGAHIGKGPHLIALAGWVTSSLRCLCRLHTLAVFHDGDFVIAQAQGFREIMA